MSCKEVGLSDPFCEVDECPEVTAPETPSYPPKEHFEQGWEAAERYFVEKHGLRSDEGDSILHMEGAWQEYEQDLKDEGVS